MENARLRPIAAHLRPLVGSSNVCVASTSRSSQTPPDVAVERAKLLMGCYRRDDTADPDTYAAAVSAILAGYSPDVVQRVTDPRTGLASRLQWLPSVKEVRDACEELARRAASAARIERQREETLAERRRFEEAKQRPTMTELRQRYGARWGLSQADDRSISEEEADRLRKERAQQVNHRILMDEYARAGVEPIEAAPGILISPALVDLIREW